MQTLTKLSICMLFRFPSWRILYTGDVSESIASLLSFLLAANGDTDEMNKPIAGMCMYLEFVTVHKEETR